MLTDPKELAAAAASACTLADPLERYEARVAVFERGLAGARAASAERAPVLLATLAGCVADALDDEPREPLLLNHLGVALHELGAPDAAEPLFRAALRLDPGLALAAANLERLVAQGGRRRRADGRGGLPAPVRATLGELERRAGALAAAARPATGLTLSLCMIVRDEEEMLPRCLEAVRDHVDEIVVVDTGSVDRTMEIARSFGARVIEQAWTGSFADARNRSFEEATGDWLLFLDADEVVLPEDAPLLREITGRTWREAFGVTEISFTGGLEDGTAVTHNALRIFRNRPRYRFDGRVHEQIADKLPSRPERIELVPLRIEHYGYLGHVRNAKAKSARNLELLEQQEADGVDSPFLHFNLGSEYWVAGDRTRALAYLERAWEQVGAERGPRGYGFTPALISRLVKALRVSGRIDDALARAQEGLEVFPGFTDLVLEQGMCERARGDEPRAREHFERCLAMGDAPQVYTAAIGAGSFVAQLALAESHRVTGDPAGAERLLLDSLREHPSFLAVVLPLADLMLARGADPAEVVRTIGGGLDHLTPSARFMLGTALYEAGAVDAAEPMFRTVVERQPSSAPARVAFAEVLLSQRRYAEAAQVAAAVEDVSPWRPAALLTEMVARMLCGQVDRALEALESGATPMPEEQRELLVALAAVLSGEPAPETLAPAAAPLLLTVLEALLRLQELDAFAAAVPLADRAGLSWREAREALAQLYLRRGYLESAADEWIAVVQREPDAAALVGLGQVAYARGLPDDALLFAQEARSLDPQHGPAERLAGALTAV